MSHDRGCPCGRESYEYANCAEVNCYKTNKNKRITRDALVFIGRFSPFHNGHKAVIEAALEQAREVVVVVGSSFAARSIRNPFTFQERKAMIRATFPSERVKVVGVSDYPLDDDKWVSAIQSLVEAAVPSARDIGLIGHSKDSSSYYLNIFPRWKNHVEVKNVAGINATDIRKGLFNPESKTLSMLVATMPEQARKVMDTSVNTHGSIDGPWDALIQEYAMIQKYKQSWATAPYAPTFVTTDAVVVQSGHVLLIERGRAPGKGLLALPGGFLNQSETIEDAMIRELHEETRIKLQPQVLRGSIVERVVVDNPDRDPRGRVITHAFYIKLKDQQDLPRVRGADDAAKATWYTFAEVLRMRDSFYSDHFHILAHFTKIG